MEFVRVYDVLSRARETLFGWIRPLSQDQYTQPFPFGGRSVRGTMVEIARAELFLAMRIREQPLPPFTDWPISAERQPTFPDLERAWGVQSQQTRATLAETTDWERAVTSRVVRPDRTSLLTATKGDLALQLLMHEVHHRAQAMAMLRQLGVEAQNLDYIRLVQRSEDLPG